MRCLIVAVIAPVLLVLSAVAADPKPFPGKASQWNGFTRHDFQVDAVSVLVVEPEKPLPGRPWAWRGEFFGAFPNADIDLVKKGWHLAYMSVPNLFGSPKDHHPHGLKDPQPILEFFNKAWADRK